MIACCLKHSILGAIRSLQVFKMLVFSCQGKDVATSAQGIKMLSSCLLWVFCRYNANGLRTRVSQYHEVGSQCFMHTLNEIGWYLSDAGPVSGKVYLPACHSEEVLANLLTLPY